MTCNHIIFIVMDSCRHDSFMAAKTPNIDRLGEAERRYSYASWTAPSHHAFAMGMLPHASPKDVFASEVYKEEYAQWKDRTANRMNGGIAQLEKELAGVAKQMVQQGISMISFKPQGLPRSFEVGPGRKVEKVNGQDVERLVFSKWLVIIPTVTKFRIIRPGDSKAVVIESIGFQVAISDKGKNDWTFIDGSGLTVNDLRGLYVNLPLDLQFPPLEKHESR